MATGGFAVPMLEALCDSRHPVIAVVTRPPKATHVRKEVESPVRAVALRRHLDLLQPESVNAPDAIATLKAIEPDLFVVADYGQILSQEALGIPKFGAINLHGSLLPKYRGAAPINWAIYHGETESGVTVIHMTPRVDAGPCIAQARLPILPDETAPQLEHRLAQLGAPLVCQAIDDLQRGDVQPIVQDPMLATRAPRLKKTDGAIDWQRPAEAIYNHVRAMQPWPGTYTFWRHASGPPQRLIIGAVTVEGARMSLPPGTVIVMSTGEVIVVAGSGTVKILNIQPAGKRMMPSSEFLRGHTMHTHDRFGPADAPAL